MKKTYFVKKYRINEEITYGLPSAGHLEFLDIIPELGIIMRPRPDSPPMEINAWTNKTRRNRFYHIVIKELGKK